jgi:hypothetical protein
MPATIQCPGCQREYPWKPDLAGKRVKCTCGQIMDVPAIAPKAEVDELYDLAEDPTPRGQHAISDLQSIATEAAVAVDESRQFPCPYCGEKLDPGSMMCVFCGSNLEGAIPETTPVAPSAMASAPPVATKPVVIPKPEPREKSARMLIVIGVTTILVVAAVFIFVWIKTKKAAPPEGFLKPADAAIFEKVKQGADARDWLKDDSHALSGMNHKQSVFHTDQWHDMGDKRVVVLNGGSSVALELPSEAAKRKAVFDWEKKWNTENNFKLVDDDGQRWMEIQMHL